MNTKILIVCAALLAAGISTGALAGAQEEQTGAIVAHHWKAFIGNELDETMLDYTEASILITPDHVYRGLKEIRDNFIKAFAGFPKAESTLQLNKTVVERNIGYILWQATAPKRTLSFGTDTFVIENGKILSQTYGGVSTPR